MTSTDLENLSRHLAGQIKSRLREETHPNYGLQLIYALWQAKLCGYKKITALEFGVASGRGFTALKSYAQQFSNHFDIEVEVKGFDTSKGLPPLRDYRDHPEIWAQGDFESRVDDKDIILGDVKNTLPEFIANWGDSKLGFVSLDLDLYHSTKDALQIFKMQADNYLPSVMIHLDDANTQLTMNPWCGAELAVTEFTQTNTMRKFEQKHRCWNMDNFYVLHVLDHSIRNGTVIPEMPISCGPL